MSDDEKDRPGFTITRVVKAPRDVVWRLWTDPAEMARWFHGDGASTPVDSVRVDLRVGGRYRYSMVVDETGDEIVTGGQYLEVVEPERLVFSWGFPDDPPESSPVATVVLGDLGDRTEVTFELRGVAGHPGDGYFYDGWVQVLDNLVGAAEQGPVG